MESNTTTFPRATANKDTMLRPGAPSCIQLLRHATHQIEGLCTKLMEEADDLEAEVDTPSCFVLLALTARIKALNSVLMSYTDGDDITVHRAFLDVYGNEAGERQWSAVEAAAPQPSTESDFMEGVDLAIDIFKMGKGLLGTEQDGCELSAKLRGKGVEQNNFALGCVQQVIDCPQLAEGFAAVLSSISAVQGQVEPEELASLTYAQIAGLKTVPKTRTVAKTRRAAVAA